MLETGTAFSILQRPGTSPTFHGFPLMILGGSVITVLHSSCDKALSCQEIQNQESQWPWGIPASLPCRFSRRKFAPNISWVHHLAEKKKPVGFLNVAKNHVQSEVLRRTYNMRSIWSSILKRKTLLEPWEFSNNVVRLWDQKGTSPGSSVIGASPLLV